jgi:uncharacterized short protein YbdD (DUF466 family)
MRHLKRWWDYLAQVMGEGEYPRYCEHLRARHPGAPVPTEREFYRQRLEEKYRRPARCC